METKIGTKTWAEPGQKTDLKSEFTQTQLTAAQKQALGAENLGAALNKVSDPNWVDPSKKVRGTGNKEMDKDAFFKLMMAQLKNQDPTNPLKNHEMAAQLAQFSTLEQMSNMNTTLKEMKAGNKPIEEFQALNMIGKKVSGDSSKLTRIDVDKEHEFAFKLPSDAKTTEIKLMNAKGDVVREFKFNELKAGENKVVWNGETEDGRKAPAGNYVFQTEATGANGQKLQVKTDFEGVISGMSFSGEGPVLQIGKQTVRLKDIRQFSDPSLMSNDQKTNDVTDLDLKKSTHNGQNNIKEETKTEAQKKAMAGSTSDVLADVGMSSEMLGKVEREISKAESKGEESQDHKPTPPSGTL
ncbi:MAG: flagellar biosynthesis protein FlgD [Moraxellaceae bacterium]|nr:flagellar biosynthesis protein FlgD [Pseudobdellovibrionaceae bacterium]